MHAQEATNLQAVEVNAGEETLRAVVDAAFKDYADDHYPAGVTTVTWLFGQASVCV